MARGLPSIKCTGTSKRSGVRCRNFATPGQLVCHMHGQTKAVERKAEVNVTLAQLMKGDPRPVGEVLLDAVHVNDVLMNQLKAEVEAGAVDLDTVTRLIEASARAGKLAKVTIDAGVAVKLVEQKERNLQLEARLVTETLTDVLDHVVNGLGMNAIRAKDVREWALSCVVARLGEREMPALPVEYAAIEPYDVPVVGPEVSVPRAGEEIQADYDDSEAELPSWMFDVDSSPDQHDR